MTKERLNVTVSGTALLLGSCLYLLFRENTLFVRLLPEISILNTLRMWLKPISRNFLKFYLPDYLWGLSLSCGLVAICGDTQRKAFLCIGTAFLCGTLWECLQFWGVVSGTGDICDVVSYFLAGILCCILNFKEKKDEKM